MDKIHKLLEISSRLDCLARQYQQELGARVQEPDNSFRSLGDLPYRVLHLNDNPTDKAIIDRKKSSELLKKENERLRARLNLLDTSARSDLKHRNDDASKSSDQIELLSRQVNELKQKEEKILNFFQRDKSEFREVCYLLTGYRIDPLKDDIFRLSHMYAEQENDRLYFEVKRDGIILLLKNEYTDHYDRFIRTYLEEADSFPAFLAAITLDLFKAQTQSVDMSVTMSTTVLPANATKTGFVVDSSDFPWFGESSRKET